MQKISGSFGVLNADILTDEPLLLLEGGIEFRKNEHYNYENDKRGDYPGYLFQYTLNGEGMFEKNEKQYPMKEETAFFVSFPEKSRYFLPTTDNAKWEFIYLHFCGDAVLPFAKQIEKISDGCFSLSKNSPPIQMLLHLHQELMQGKSLKKYEGGEFVYRFLCSLLRELEYPTALKKDDLIEEALLIMEKEYAQIESIESLAFRLGISKEHFSRLFTQKRKRSPLQYLTDIRIQSAMQNLLNTSKTLEQIAQENGFSNANYFCKVFRKYTNQTPTDYRRKN